MFFNIVFKIRGSPYRALFVWPFSVPDMPKGLFVRFYEHLSLKLLLVKKTFCLSCIVYDQNPLEKHPVS